jgi:hypothetical protein
MIGLSPGWIREQGLTERSTVEVKTYDSAIVIRPAKCEARTNDGPERRPVDENQRGQFK